MLAFLISVQLSTFTYYSAPQLSINIVTHDVVIVRIGQNRHLVLLAVA